MTVHLNREIEKLKKKILFISELVEESMQKAVHSLRELDTKLAANIIDADEQIDQLEVEVEEDCLKILALHAPVANDLRYVIAILKINHDLERIADQSVNIAERALFIASKEPIEIPSELDVMVDKAQTMLEKSLTSFINLDLTLAREVIDADDEVDEIHDKMFTLITDKIRKHPERLECLIQILVVSRHLERIADQVTNIAEDVIYLVNGEIVRHGINANTKS